MRLANWKRKRDAIRHYDRLADIYDTLYGNEQSAKIKVALDAVPIDSPDAILDVGCGTGLLLDHMGDIIGVHVGVDTSLGLLRVAAHRSNRHRRRSPVCPVRADIEYLPFSSRVFDKVFAFTLLQNMIDPSIALHEMNRVAKDSSVIVVTGLRKSFSEESLGSILSNAGLDYTIVEAAKEASDIVAVCRKSHKVKDK